MQGILSGELVPVLQTAISPIILISGIGFLMLTMTNRMSRVIDRARQLVDDPVEDKQRNEAQLSILWDRARFLRIAILLATMSMLSSALLVIVLFIAALTRVELGLLIILCFIGSMCFLIGSLGVYIRDVNQSLAALKVELHPRKL